MQAQLHRRFADGLSLNVNYTLARGKSDNENSSFTPAVQALAYSSRNYALISTDRPTTWVSPARGNCPSAPNGGGCTTAACCRTSWAGGR